METFKALLKPIIVILMMVRLFFTDKETFKKALEEIEQIIIKIFTTIKLKKGIKK